MQGVLKRQFPPRHLFAAPPISFPTITSHGVPTHLPWLSPSSGYLCCSFLSFFGNRSSRPSPVRKVRLRRLSLQGHGDLGTVSPWLDPVVTPSFTFSAATVPFSPLTLLSEVTRFTFSKKHLCVCVQITGLSFPACLNRHLIQLFALLHFSFFRVLKK